MREGRSESDERRKKAEAMSKEREKEVKDEEAAMEGS